jgi:O-antigen/teichoic acid export membrane protein
MIKKRKLIGNSFAMTLYSLVQSITTFVLTAAIARLLGAKELGQYLLAFSYYFIFVSIVSHGLKTLFVRKLARTQEDLSACVVNGTILQLLLGLIGYGSMALIVSLLPYSSDTKMVCYIMGVAIVPFSLSNITEAIFQAQERMHLIAFSTVPVYLLRLLVAIAMMQMGYGINVLVGVYVLAEVLILIVEWSLLLPSVCLKWAIEPDFMWQTLKAASTFFLLDGTSILNTRVEILILSLLGNETLVGLYGAIAQLMQPFLIIANSVALAIFPSMSKAVEMGRDQQRKLSENVIEILLLGALPFFVGLLFVGEDLLTLVYGSRSGFGEAATALTIVSLSLLMLPFNRPLTYVLVSNGLERINLREVTLTLVLKGILGTILVWQYQLLGAAIAYAAIALFSFSWYMSAVYRHLFSLHWWQTLRRPLLVGALMLIVFVILQKTSSSFIETLVVACLAYCIFVGIVGVYAFGGPRKAWMKLTKNQL